MTETLELFTPGRLRDERRRREFTLGDWATEQESATAFDEAMPSDLFEAHKEVRGALIQPRPAQADRGNRMVRIDRVLVPSGKLIALGWNFGFIGIEIKRSGERVGPPMSQAMDYSRSVFTLEPFKFRILLDYVFVWPVFKQGSTVGSLQAQNRIGSAFTTGHSKFQLMSGETPILRVDTNDSVHVGSTPLTGARVGSR